MLHFRFRRFSACRFLVAFQLCLLPCVAHAFTTFPAPTLQELNMSAPAEDPRANAVYLSFDEDDNDQMNVHVITVRLKVLTQAGVKRYSDVQIGVPERHFAIENVEAQTVHQDGSVIPFTGKPFLKTVRYRGEMSKETVFSMPDVQVGSILEYRYRLAYSDHVLLPAHWYVQQDAFVEHAHFTFRPFSTTGSHYVVVDHGQTSAGLLYVSSLPKDAVVVPANGAGHPYFELTAANIPALPDEDAMPPIKSFSYRVLFYYAAQLDSNSYWAREGKFISKDMNSFATAGPRLRADVAALVTPADTPEAKARKLYAAAMKIENTDYTREHSRDEDKEQGLRAVKTAEDIWTRQRGSSSEIALTYLAMLRTAGLHAYGMDVTDRDRNLFEPNFIDTSQLDDTIVIASLDGKDVFLDPGTRFCPYGLLAWRHSWARGIRQTDSGTEIATAGPLVYKDNFTHRVAKLGLLDDGTASGTFTLTYGGQEAIAIREREDGEALADTKQRFEEDARSMLPGGMKLHVISIDNLGDGEKPLQVTFGVSGAIGTPHGHRLLIAQSLLRGDEHERFTSPDRKSDIYFHYPYMTVDIVDLALPPGMKLEGVPPDVKAQAMNSMAYSFHTVVTGNNVEMQRSMALADIVVPVADYPKLRDFLGNLHSADEDQLVLAQAPTPAAGSATGAAQHAPGN
jgi:hypothetical protein